MLARAPALVTESEYLELEAASLEKHEFVNGEVLAMSGVSYHHSTIAANLVGALKARLRGKPCQPHGSDLRVHTSETGLYAYPDLVIVCGEPELTPSSPPSLLNPRVLIEVLSESTERHDRVVKVAHYRHRGSVDAIVLVDSRRRLVEIQTRNAVPAGAHSTWTLDERTEGELAIAVLDVVIPFDEVYEGVTFPPVPTAQARPRPRASPKAR